MHFLPKLIAALAIVETGGDPALIGDGGEAYGPLQIHQIVIVDVNRIYGTAYRWPDDAIPLAKAREICRLYLTHYGRFIPHFGPQDAARIWNGGPTGHRERATIPYWRKVLPVYTAQVKRGKR